VEWYTVAAEQCHVYAQQNLGAMYLQGQGVVQDNQIAAKWFALAAVQGAAPSQHVLGTLYLIGRGVAQDYIKSYLWLHIAAKDGSVQEAAKSRDLVAAKMTPVQIAQAKELTSRFIIQRFENCRF